MNCSLLKLLQLLMEIFKFFAAAGIGCHAVIFYAITRREFKCITDFYRMSRCSLNITPALWYLVWDINQISAIRLPKHSWHIHDIYNTSPWHHLLWFVWPIYTWYIANVNGISYIGHDIVLTTTLHMRVYRRNSRVEN